MLPDRSWPGFSATNRPYFGSSRQSRRKLCEDRGGITKLLAACRRVLLVCKLRHHLDGVFCPEAERVSSGVAV
jgi:hypothetical protein